MKKYFLLFIGLVTVGAMSAFGADTLSADVDKLIDGSVGTAQKGGAGMLYIAAGYLPGLVILGSAFYGWMGALKEKQPNDSAIKMITATLSNGMYGYIVAVVIWAIIGLMADGDVTSGAKLTIHFWSSGLADVAGKDVFK